jgi:hypothetical protein
MKKRAPIIPASSVETRILTIRGQKVILDADLAAITVLKPNPLIEPSNGT